MPKPEYLVSWKKNGRPRSKGKIVHSLVDASTLAEEKSRNGCIGFFKKIPPKGKDKEKRQEIRNISHPP
jgi:hypothetical protein